MVGFVLFGGGERSHRIDGDNVLVLADNELRHETQQCRRDCLVSSEALDFASTVFNAFGDVYFINNYQNVLLID